MSELLVRDKLSFNNIWTETGINGGTWTMSHIADSNMLEIEL